MEYRKPVSPRKPSAGKRVSKALTSKGRRSPGKAALVRFVNRRELDPAATLFPLSDLKGYLSGLSRTENMPYTFRLGYDAAVTTDGSGLLQTVISNSPTSAQNWSTYASTFDEYRVLAVQARFEPLWATGGSTQTYWAPIAHVVDRSDATALTGYGLAERYESHRKTPGQRKFTVSMNMASVEESSFISTGSSTPNMWIKFYSSGNTVSLTVGRLDVIYLVQFRGLGIN